MDHTTRIMLIAGLIASGVAIVAWVGDRRRMRRTDMDRVGFMPWTPIFFWSLMAAVVLLGVVARSFVGR